MPRLPFPLTMGAMSESWTDGEAYDALMGRWSRTLAPQFLKWLRLPSGAKILDVGCGTGSLSRALVQGGASHVVGVDVSPDFVAQAASTAKAEGDRLSFEVGDAMKLRFENGVFDGVVSSLVLNFIPQPGVAVEEMRRVVRDGGIVAACVWDYAGGMQMLRRFWDAAVALQLPGARELDEGVRFPMCHPHRLLELFGRIASNPETVRFDVPMEFRDFNDYWHPFLSGMGPSGAFVEGLTEAQRDQMREYLGSHMPRADDGKIRLVSKAWAVRAAKR
jgi:SAM-dependent methyltransferase